MISVFWWKKFEIAINRGWKTTFNKLYNQYLTSEYWDIINTKPPKYIYKKYLDSILIHVSVDSLLVLPSSLLRAPISRSPIKCPSNWVSAFPTSPRAFRICTPVTKGSPTFTRVHLAAITADRILMTSSRTADKLYLLSLVGKLSAGS